MKKILFFVGFLLLVGCSSQDLGITDLKETYPDTFASGVESLTEEQQSKLGLPDETPFTVSSVSAATNDNQTQVEYQSDGSEKLVVTTVYEPGNVLEELDLQLNLNSGAVAGAEEREDSFYMEWYNGEEDVIYQIEYFGNGEEMGQKTLKIANSI
ncbi:hypothetical protein [Halobacillus salinus]|uniref:DUF4367 domain-containing protein n=1 Tax=Halobacillus salinus TaxID=192814 RepID=A0A4Z0H3G3_9BACI|nr:hypothetical protein [Halobacillus salinus]TGB03971.1 hypothetical protein E4663_02895 [Halobacillus salinus]